MHKKTKIHHHKYISPLSIIKKFSKKHLYLKYNTTPSFHNIKIINDIIFNEETHYVAIFKEYLIYEEINEFLKRFYFREEIKHKMPRILLFYDKYSKIYANYTQLPESKYMYKNIKRKQKMIDKLQEIEEEEANNKKNNKHEQFIKDSNVFTPSALESINSVTMSLLKNESLYTNTQGSISINLNNFIEKINICEQKQNKKIVSTIRTSKDNSHSHNKNKSNCNSNYHNYNKKVKSINYILKKKTKSAGNSVNTTTYKKHLNGLVSPINVIKGKIINNNITHKLSNKNNTKGNKCKNYNIYYKIQYNHIKENIFANEPYNHKLNNEKFSSANSSRSKTERVVSSPTQGGSITTKHARINLINKKVNPKLIKINSARDSNNNSLNLIKKSEVTVSFTKGGKNKYKSKIFSGGGSGTNSYKKIIKNYNNINHYNSDSYSKTKTKPKIKQTTSTININNNGVISSASSLCSGNNNVNIINNIQTGATQINIYNCNDLLKSIHFHSGSILQSVVGKKPLLSSRANNSKQKYDFNIRRLMHRRIVESELSNDHNITGNNGPNTNLFSEKLGKNCLGRKISQAHIKVNSASTSVNNTESKMHTRVGSSLKHSNIKKNNTKSLKNSYNNVNKDVSSTGSVVNNNHYNNDTNNNTKRKLFDVSRIKLKHFNDLNHFLLKNTNSMMLHSDRNKKSKISFK